MYKLCKTEHSANRQRALEDGLLEAMSAHHYDELSVSDLCDRMGIPRKSFYRYFSGKEGALHALLDHTLMEFEPFALSFSGSGSRTIHSEMMLFFRFWLLKKSLLDALQRSGLSDLLISRAILYASSDAVIPQRFMPDRNQEQRAHTTTFVVSGLLSLVLKWHHEGYPQSVSQMAELGVRLMTQPLFPNLHLI